MTYFAARLFARTPAAFAARTRPPRRPSAFFGCRLPSDKQDGTAAAVVVVNDGGGVGLLVGHQIIHLIYLRSFTTTAEYN